MEILKVMVVVALTMAVVECKPTFRNGLIIQEEITDIPVTAIENKEEETIPETMSEPKGSPIDAGEVSPIQEPRNSENVLQEREDYTLKEFPNLIKSQLGYNAELNENSNEEESQLIQDRLLKPKNKVCFDPSILKSNSKVGSILRKIISRDLQAEIMEVRVEEMVQNHKRK